MTGAPNFSTYNDLDGPRINIDDNLDENDPEENSGNFSAVTGGIVGAICLVAIVNILAVLRRRNSGDDSNNDQGEILYNH